MAIKCPKCQTDNPDTLKFCGECGTKLIPTEEISAPTETLEAAKEELTTGSIFAGRYQIIEELGKGGMGKVYKAQDTDLKEKVAIKLLKPEIAADKKTIERFRNELKFARKIRHKNVCQMYDLNKAEGAHYITMEYVDGKNLKSMIRMMGQLGSGKTISIAKQVCDGLTEAHRLGVVHRDLKPQNIMVDEEGNARIMDFGIARSLKTKGITATGVMIGTPEYMSPEQVEGKEVDQRSDIYSLGVILYEMVTGRVPFEGDTPFTIGVKHKSEVPKDPKEFNTQLPEDLNLVILRCLEKDREKRYQSAGEVRAELTRIEKGIPTTEIEIPKRKPLTSREITVTFGLKKLFIPALVVIGLIVAGVIIWQLLPQKEAIPVVPSDKPSLAVMYFENNTGDESLDHWRKMFSDLLITDLTQSKYLRVLSGDRLFKILKDINQLETKTFSADVLKEVADRGRVGHLLLGKYAKMGDTFRIDVVLQEARTGEIISSLRVEAQGEKEIFPKVDELTRQIKADFRLSAEQIAGDMDKEVGKITTSSPEAYKYYSEGKRSYDLGDDRKAIQFYEKAVAIDPEFATAYRDMAISYYNLGLFSEEEKCIQKALALSDRVSDRERYLNEAEFYIRLEKTYDKAIEAFNKLLEYYPDDIDGNADLGYLYRELEQLDKAIERYEVNVKNKVAEAYTYQNLAGLYRDKELYDKAQEVLESYLNDFPDNVAIRRSLALNYVHQGKLDLALAEMDKAFYLNPTGFYNFVQKGDIYLYKGDLTKAEQEYQKSLKSREPADQLWGILGLSELYLLQGKFEKTEGQVKQAKELANKVGEIIWKSYGHNEAARYYLKSGNPKEALKECDEAWRSAVEADELFNQRYALYNKGLAFVEMKAIDEAQEAADDLREIIEKGLNKKLMRLYYHLTGRIELERANFSKAIEYFKKAINLEYGPLTVDASFIDSLASAYYKAGDLEKAREEYERITSLITGRRSHGDIYAKSFFNLGKIYEQQGNKAKAREHYEKFLKLWKDADPGITEVEHAKKRLASLKSQ